jgi:hypothetical protein
VNCRNTAEIATQTAVTAGRPLDESLPVIGPDVRYFHFADESQHRKAATAILKEWLDEGVPPHDIVVLGQRSLGFTPLAGGELRGTTAQLVESTRPDERRRVIRYRTIASFKGLEAEAVLYLDCGRLPPGPASSADVYVAMSRARSLLAVGIDERYREAHAKLYAAFGARVAGVKAPG